MHRMKNECAIVSPWISHMSQRPPNTWRWAEQLSQGICKDLSKPIISVSWGVGNLEESLHITSIILGC